MTDDTTRAGATSLWPEVDEADLTAERTPLVPNAPRVRLPTKPLKTKSGSFKENPCLALYGAGPEGKRCQTCRFLYYHKASQRWYKCELRGEPTRGPGTDHRVRWPACAHYEEGPGEVEGYHDH